MDDKKEEVERIAFERMVEFGLIEKGWVFEWSKKKRIHGDCSYVRKRIRVSEYFLYLKSLEDLTNTINHEIAHAIVGGGHGHRKIWKEACLKTGARPVRLNTTEYLIEPDYKWIGKCLKCGKEYGRYRLTNRFQSCSKCSKTYDPTNLLIWKQIF